jgi:HAD superfamily hydrolase (TIGR01509 family)
MAEIVNFEQPHWHFDFDGTLFFTLDALCAAYRISVNEFGGVWTTVAEDSLRSGNNFQDFLPKCIWHDTFADLEGIRNLKNRIFLRRISDIRPNLELLKFAAHLPNKSSIVTTAGRGVVEEILEHYNVSNLFVSIVSYEDVKTPKPSPECYLKSIEMNPAAFHIAIEDSAIGIQSAISAGMLVFQYRAII